MIISSGKIFSNTQINSQKQKSDVNNNPMRKNSADTVSFSHNDTFDLIKAKIHKKPFIKTPMEDFERYKKSLEDGKENIRLRNQIWENNLRLVFIFAKNEDDFQMGAMGLKKAIEKFDPEAGFKFSTYASYSIKQSINRDTPEISKHIIRVSERAKQKMTPQNFNALQTDSLSTPTMLSKGDLKLTLGATLKSQDPNVEELIKKQQRHQLLTSAFEKIAKESQTAARNVEIYKMRLLDPTLSFKEIGIKFNITRQRAEQICSSMHKKVVAIIAPKSPDELALEKQKQKISAITTKTVKQPKLMLKIKINLLTSEQPSERKQRQELTPSILEEIAVANEKSKRNVEIYKMRIKDPPKTLEKIGTHFNLTRVQIWNVCKNVKVEFERRLKEKLAGGLKR